MRFWSYSIALLTCGPRCGIWRALFSSLTKKMNSFMSKDNCWSDFGKPQQSTDH